MAKLDAAHQCLVDGGLPEQDVVGVERKIVSGEAATRGGIPLRIGVDEQRTLLRDSERGSEIYGGSSLSDSAFLIGDGEDASHGGWLKGRREDA